MSFDKFKKRAVINTEPEVPENPYTKKFNSTFEKKEVKENKQIEDPDSFKKDSYFISKVTTLERENKELKEDIMSLYIMIMNIDTTDLTIEEVRALYTEFKKDVRHVLHKKQKPF